MSVVIRAFVQGVDDNVETIVVAYHLQEDIRHFADAKGRFKGPVPFIFFEESLQIFTASLVLNSYMLDQRFDDIDDLLSSSVLVIAVEVGEAFGGCINESCLKHLDNGRPEKSLSEWL